MSMQIMPTLKSLIFMRNNHKSRILFPRASHSLLRVFVSLVYEQICYRSTISVNKCWWQMAEAWRGFLKRLKKACMCKLALGRFRSYGLKSQDEVPKQGEEEEENSDPECGVLISGPRFARGLWLRCQEKIQRLPGLPKRTLRTRKEFQMSKRSTTRFLLFLLHGQEPRRAWKLRWTRSCPKTLRGRFWWHKIENRACSCCNYMFAKEMWSRWSRRSTIENIVRLVPTIVAGFFASIGGCRRRKVWFWPGD